MLQEAYQVHKNEKIKRFSITSLLLPRLQDIFFIAIFIFVCMQGSYLLNGDGDLGRHITLGKYILDNKTIPTHDVFSHTMTGSYLVPHEWAAEVLFALANRLMDLDGVVILSGIIIATTFMIVYRQTVDRGVFHLASLFIVTWAALASFLHWLARPHIFTFLFAAIWTFHLERAIIKGRPRSWVLPLIMLIWANTHGAFIFGFIILSAYFAGWAWEYWHGSSDKETGIYLAHTGFLSFLITFMNPAGWRLWATSVGYMESKFLVDRTNEYLSPNFHIPSTWPFLIMLALSILFLGIGGKLRLHEILLLSGWSVLSLYSARNIPLYAIITAPYFGVLIQPLIDKNLKLQKANSVIMDAEKHLHGFLFPVLATLSVIFLFLFGVQLDSAQKGNQYNASKFPVDAVNWLQNNPQNGNMFNEFTWGGYLLYRLWPDQTVFIDGQTDFYGEALTREYIQVSSFEEDWKNVLGKYNVSWMILPSNSLLIKELQGQLCWEIIYQDKTATIIRKP